MAGSKHWIDQPFPQLSVAAVDGTVVQLNPRRSVLVFYRGAWCGQCQIQLAGLRTESDAIRRLGFAITVISADDEATAGATERQANGNYTVLRDPNATEIDRLDIVNRFDEIGRPIAHPSVFIIDDGGVVRFAHLGHAPGDWPTAALLKLAVESLASQRTAR